MLKAHQYGSKATIRKVKTVIYDGFLSEKYSFYSVSPDEVQKTNSGEEFEHRGDPDKHVAVLNHTQAPDVPTAPTTRLQKHVGKHISYLKQKQLFNTTSRCLKLINLAAKPQSEK